MNFKNSQRLVCSFVFSIVLAPFARASESKSVSVCRKVLESSLSGANSEVTAYQDRNAMSDLVGEVARLPRPSPFRRTLVITDNVTQLHLIESQINRLHTLNSREAIDLSKRYQEKNLANAAIVYLPLSKLKKFVFVSRNQTEYLATNLVLQHLQDYSLVTVLMRASSRIPPYLATLMQMAKSDPSVSLKVYWYTQSVIPDSAEVEDTQESNLDAERPSSEKPRYSNYIESLKTFESVVLETPDHQLRKTLRGNSQLYTWYIRLKTDTAKKKLQVPFLHIFSLEVREKLIRVYPKHFSPEEIESSRSLGSLGVPLESALTLPSVVRHGQSFIQKETQLKIQTIGRWIDEHSVEELRDALRSGDFELKTTLNNLRARDPLWPSFLSRSQFHKLLQTGQIRVTKDQLQIHEESLSQKTEDKNFSSEQKDENPAFLKHFREVEKIIGDYSAEAFHKQLSRKTILYKFMYRLRHPDRPFLRVHWLLIFPYSSRLKLLQAYGNEIPLEVRDEHERLGIQRVHLRDALPERSYLQRYLQD